MSWICAHLEPNFIDSARFDYGLLSLNLTMLIQIKRKKKTCNKLVYAINSIENVINQFSTRE